MNFAFSSRATLGVCLCGLSACRAIVITPQALRTAAVPELERSELARTWTEAVARCNAFQSSPFRHALPPGRFVLDDVQGMRFEGLQGAWPIEVRCTGWGDVVQAFGFVAQEGRGGFTVGDCNPERDRVADNGLFRTENGDLLEAGVIAELILHESTHVIYDEGAIGFWKTIEYYLETVILFRYGSTHTDERRAYSTGEEYLAFARSVGRSAQVRAELLGALEQHIASGAGTCRHQSKDPPPPPLSLPPSVKRTAP